MNQRNLLRQVSQLLTLTAGLAALSAQADVKLPAIFGDHMVLQRDQKVPVWGWADEDELIIVQFRDQVVQTRAKGGKWSVNLAPMKASSTGKDFLVLGKNRVEFKNVVVGDVWFCSGQSNMEWSVAASKNAKDEIAAANNPRIRHFKVPHVTSAKPETEVKTTGGWQPTTSAVAGSFTAVGYFFAREIQKDLDVPIGLIGCNWGGTRIEPWTPPIGFQSVPALKNISTNLHNFPQKNAAGAINQQSALAIYNAMVHPLVPYAIRGALWYQGESNNGEGMLYFEKKKALIGGWRSLWGQGSFPFLFVQLAPFNYGPARAEHLPGIWEAQTATLAIPNTGMAVTTDIATVSNIHPPDKQEVGRRLALWALAKTYGKPVKSYASPLYDSLKIDGGKARVSFQHADGGLKSLNGQPLTWFTLAGADKKFVPATAEISGNSVIVSAPGVSKPVAVRFGWHQLAEPNLANAAGLPASPFRTDKWTDATMPVVAPPTPPPAKK
ncbi:MAG: sialate O-acetylesterase [Limisphaerales bacterium]|nr:MAG: sialate O-acetylesterase [Limisphaerales bacterium]KAG0507554.1 MAG: sialate O-acetylesterase [Limisphaerales bacterium]TXT48004.1 MAG: sialate O-acetylesterase [Limisphaerales bacterium]